MKKSHHHIAALLFWICLALAGRNTRAQVFSPPAPTLIRPDTTETREVVVTPAAKRSKAAADSAKRTEHMFRAFGYQGIRLTRPGKAALLAAILPGAGQIYNRTWWKLPLVYGALGTVVGGEIFYQTHYHEFDSAINLVKTGQKKIGSTDLPGITSRYTSLEALLGSGGIGFYRGYRDTFYLYIALAYSLQIVDALVDAHLKDFDVSDDLSLHWEPTLLSVPGQARAFPTNPGVMLALRVK